MLPLKSVDSSGDGIGLMRPRGGVRMHSPHPELAGSRKDVSQAPMTAGVWLKLSLCSSKKGFCLFCMVAEQVPIPRACSSACRPWLQLPPSPEVHSYLKQLLDSQKSMVERCQMLTTQELTRRHKKFETLGTLSGQTG